MIFFCFCVTMPLTIVGDFGIMAAIQRHLENAVCFSDIRRSCDHRSAAECGVFGQLQIKKPVRTGGRYRSGD